MNRLQKYATGIHYCFGQYRDYPISLPHFAQYVPMRDPLSPTSSPISHLF